MIIAEATNTGYLDALAYLTVSIVGAIITIYVVPLLKGLAAKAGAERQNVDLSKNQKLIAMLKEFTFGTAAAIAEHRFQQLAQDIKDGKLKNKLQIKEELYSWGDELKELSIEYFDKQGVDIEKAVGEDFIDKMIERAANAASPVQGVETAEALMDPKVVNSILDKGIYGPAVDNLAPGGGLVIDSTTISPN